MKNSKLLLSYLVCATMTIFLACKKSDVGPRGDSSQAGQPGRPGNPGATGTATIIYSDWMDSTWYIFDTTHVGASIDTLFGIDFNVPKLTTDIINTAGVKVYVNSSNDPVNNPFIFFLPYNDGGVLVNVNYRKNVIELTSNINLSGALVRYVLKLDGTVARTYNSIDWKNYAEVKAYLGLKN